MSLPPEDLVSEHLPHLGADPSEPPEPLDDIESEPRQRWKPKEELLRALEDARRDLKPGEAALYWDWTKTRDSVPEAEDMRPSGEGEVLVSDKEAAAAYVAPKEVAPAVAPRPLTKSRIRVREDVDPRRAPTVRNAREHAKATLAKHRVANARNWRSPPSGSHRLKKLAAPRPPEDDGQALAGSLISTEAGLELDPPMLGPERRRRVAWAFFFGMVTGIIVFFWLRFPGDPGRSSQLGAPALTPSGSAPLLRFGPAHRPAPVPAPPPAPPPDAATAVAPIEAPIPSERPAAEPAGTSASVPNTTSAPKSPGGSSGGGGARSAPPSGKAPSGAAGDASARPPTTSPEPKAGGFLIRKKGS